MKRKIYFIISAISCILLSIYTIFISNEIVKNQIKEINEMDSILGEQLKNRMMSILQSSGNRTIIFTSIIVIILNLIILYFIKKNTLYVNKGSMITISLICLLLSQSDLVFLICITNIIVMIFSKKEISNEKNSKKDLKIVKQKKITRKDILLGIMLFTIYFSQFVWKDFVPNNTIIRIIIVIGFDILIFALCIFVFFKELKDGFKALKENKKGYIKFILSKLGAGYLLYVFTMTIALYITKIETTVNQEAIESLPVFYTIPLAIIWAPIVEEILFRGVLRRFIKNNILYIVISGFIFGLLHTMGEASLLNVFILAIPYGVIGGMFAYMYVKTNNILTNISSHALFNTIASIITLL